MELPTVFRRTHGSQVHGKDLGDLASIILELNTIFQHPILSNNFQLLIEGVRGELTQESIEKSATISALNSTKVYSLQYYVAESKFINDPSNNSVVNIIQREIIYYARRAMISASYCGKGYVAEDDIVGLNNFINDLKYYLNNNLCESFDVEGWITLLQKHGKILNAINRRVAFRIINSDRISSCLQNSTELLSQLLLLVSHRFFVQNLGGIFLEYSESNKLVAQHTVMNKDTFAEINVRGNHVGPFSSTILINFADHRGELTTLTLFTSPLRDLLGRISEQRPIDVFLNAVKAVNGYLKASPDYSDKASFYELKASLSKVIVMGNKTC